MPFIPETWLDSQTVNTTTSGSQTQPNIAQLANGNILVTWTTNDPSGLGSPAGTEVFGQLYDPLGVAIGTEFRINGASLADNERDSDIVALPGGGFIVIYHDDDIDGLGGSNIRLEEFDATGLSVSDSTSVVGDSGASGLPNYANPRGAASSATSVMIVYDKIEAGGTGVFCAVYDPTTNTYGVEIPVMTGGITREADIAVLTNGNYVIAARNASGDSAIHYRILNAAGGNVLGNLTVVGTNTNGDIDREPTVAALSGGGFVIAYTNTDDIDTDLLFHVYSAAGVQTSIGVAGNSGPTNENNEPVVTGLADGSFIVAYDNDEFNVGVASHISAAGIELGTFTFTGPLTQLAITPLADGRFAVAYLGGAEIEMEIMDTRDAPNDPYVVYGNDNWQVGTAGNDFFTTDDFVEVVHGWFGDDTITENADFAEHYGDIGNDRINVTGLIGIGRFYGGAGIDTIDWNLSAQTSSTFDLQAGTSSNNVFSGVMVGFEIFRGNDAGNIIIGSNVANLLVGGAGDDSINGGNGFDSMAGSSGNDTYFVNTINDIVLEFVSQGANDRIIASGSFALSVGSEVERLSASNPAGVVAINLFGNALAQTISGNNGVNVLSSGATGLADTLRGFVGDDIYRVFNTGDIIVEVNGEGVADRVAAAVDFILAADDDIEFLATDNLLGVSAIDLTGNARGQVIVGNAGTNILTTGGGDADTLQGLGGADIYRVFNAADVIIESAGGGIDRVAAAVDFNLAADDNIETLATNGAAGVASIDLRGNALSQTVEGNAGANILNGLGGTDILTGFAGADIFVFNSALGATNIDSITDYNVAADSIRLENAIFAGLATGALAAAAFHSSLTGLAADASDRIMYETGTGFLWFDADGSGAGVRIQFADLAGGLAITAADFAVV